MGKPKLEKFAEVNSFSNVFQNFDFSSPKLQNCNGDYIDHKDCWNKKYWSNGNPIVLELACGKGDYTVQLAKEFPDKNYIGIDIKGSRIWTGAKHAISNQLTNVAFIRTRIEHLQFYFGEDEVDEIWITFPDPFPRKSDSKHRLSHKRFLDIYQKVCKAGSIVHFKTDNKPLFDYSMGSAKDAGYKILSCVEDIYSQSSVNPLLKLQTYYEKMHLAEGRKINYFKFQLP